VLFRSFSFSFGYNNASTDASYLGNDYTDNKYGLNMPSLSFVASDQKSNEEVRRNGWVSNSFGISMIRRNGFNQSFLFQGENNANTILDRFSEEMDFLWQGGLEIDSSTYGGMAYFAHLVDPVFGDNDQVIGFVPSVEDNSDILVKQRQSLSSRGSINDINFSYAGNYNNKVMIGATLGVPFLSYVEKGTFEEYNLDYLVDNYNELSVRHRINDKGIGIFGQFGVIVKPIHVLRFGASIKTPTFYSINRTFNVWFNSEADSKTARIEPNASFYSYNLITPWTGNLSAAFVLKNFGFISADYSYQDGSITRLRGTDGDGGLTYFDTNLEMEDALSAVHQFRIGSEFVFGPFAVRAGQTFTSSAYNEGYMPDNNMYVANTSSFGLGYREAKFYMDAGFQSMSRNTFFQPYRLYYADVEGANLKERYTSLILTFGFNF
jgi:hypothetical protein